MLNQTFISLFANNKTPIIFSALVLALLIGFFVFRLFKKKEGYWLPKKWALIAIVIITTSKVFYSAALTILQYFVWKDGGVMQYSLPPHQPWNYFAGYSFTHFFYGTLLGIISAIVFYFLLKAVRKYRAEILEEEEIELGAVGALIIGWPGSIIYITLAFLVLVVLSLFNRVFFKDSYTTITWPLIISLIITFFLSNQLINLLNLSVLRI